MHSKNLLNISSELNVEDELICEECGKDCDFLYAKTQFGGNNEVRDFCIDCYK